ncbi:MAG: hypothetical protein MZU84_00850 [Sphingobacterium sp.]|nr:hypothetical protein [Sphingobacterium sp.]
MGVAFSRDASWVAVKKHGGTVRIPRRERRLARAHADGDRRPVVSCPRAFAGRDPAGLGLWVTGSCTCGGSTMASP